MTYWSSLSHVLWRESGDSQDLEVISYRDASFNGENTLSLDMMDRFVVSLVFVKLLMLCTIVCYVSAWADLYFVLKEHHDEVQVKKSKLPCSHMHHLQRNPDKTWITMHVCSGLEVFHNNGLTAVFLSGISKLAKFKIFQASNFFFFLVDFLEQKLSITHSHQLGLLSGSGFFTWRTESGFDLVEILQCAVC